MLLTNTVKELEENLDFGIQKLIKSEPGLIPVNNDDEKHLMTLMAMRMSLTGKGLGSGQQQNENNENCSFTRTRKMRKIKPF